MVVAQFAGVVRQDSQIPKHVATPPQLKDLFPVNES